MRRRARCAACVRPAFARTERYVSGSVYLGLGLATARSGSGRK
jgi:hypothetical protein